ncbi:30S ribosomal protein S4 [Patescibacteria group bacterium]|nr:30S ribosomal protein S4 [Patescibacteria group bacterium]
MANLISPKCKLCRRTGEKLFLKGERCFLPKCAMVKRPYPPGRAKKNVRRGGFSEFGRQLTQKQKIKKVYGVFERQLKKYFIEARAKKGDARENLMRRFETRLDNVIFRLGWAKSRAAARQLVNHGHVLINNKRVSIPSYQVKKGETITLTERTKKSKLIENLLISLKKYQAPTWLGQEPDELKARVLGVPAGEDLGDISAIGLIVEYYSR